MPNQTARAVNERAVRLLLALTTNSDLGIEKGQITDAEKIGNVIYSIGPVRDEPIFLLTTFRIDDDGLGGDFDGCPDGTYEKESEAKKALAETIKRHTLPCFADAENTIDTVVDRFWNVFSKNFPELKSGDSQMVGEDRGAFGLWLCGDAGGNPIVDNNYQKMPVNAVFTDDRIRACIEEGTQAGLKEWMDAGFAQPKDKSIPAHISYQLEVFVRHILWANGSGLEDA